MPQAAYSFTEEITATPANGTVFYTQTVVTNFAKMSQTSRNKWLTLAQARLLTIIEKKIEQLALSVKEKYEQYRADEAVAFVQNMRKQTNI